MGPGGISLILTTLKAPVLRIMHTRFGQNCPRTYRRGVKNINLTLKSVTKVLDLNKLDSIYTEDSIYFSCSNCGVENSESPSWTFWFEQLWKPFSYKAHEYQVWSNCVKNFHRRCQQYKSSLLHVEHNTIYM